MVEGAPLARGYRGDVRTSKLPLVCWLRPSPALRRRVPIMINILRFTGTSSERLGNTSRHIGYCTLELTLSCTGVAGLAGKGNIAGMLSGAVECLPERVSQIGKSILLHVGTRCQSPVKPQPRPRGEAVFVPDLRAETSPD